LYELQKLALPLEGLTFSFQTLVWAHFAELTSTTGQYAKDGPVAWTLQTACAAEERL
jgi:hypothetical protein